MNEGIFILEISNLSYKYKNKKIFENITLSLGKGLYQIKGQSGCGKSTLLYLIKGILPSKIKHNYKISMMCQEIFLDENKSVYKTLKEITNDEKSICYYLDYFNLNKKQKINQLSLGQKQKVSFIQTILNSADIYLFDEPTSNLDEENEEKVYQILTMLSKDHCVIFTSHKTNNLGKSIEINNNFSCHHCFEDIPRYKHKRKTTKILIKPQKILLYIIFSFVLLCINKEEKNIDKKYNFNDVTFKQKDLYSENNYHIYDYIINGINEKYEGVIINKVASQKYQLPKESSIYEIEDNKFITYTIIDVIEDDNFLPVFYFSSQGNIKETEKTKTLLDKPIRNIKTIMNFSLFVCFVAIILIYTEKQMKSYLNIDILNNTQVLFLFLLMENVFTSLCFVVIFPNKILFVTNIIFNLVLFFYIKKREVSLLRNSI